MNPSIDLLAKSILQKDTLEQCNVQELQQLTDQYPYFSAAQLLLAKKMKEENNELYKEQLQKTSLLFYNPLWLEYLMNDSGNAEIIPGEFSNPAPTAIETETGPDIEKRKEEEETQQTDVGEINTETFNLSEEKEPEIIEQPEMKPEPVEASIQKEPDLSIEMSGFKIEPPDIYRDDPAKASLIFEPYHTVDYFASQGIKFKEEEKPKDKFGQQLKSFTEWLKTLKRLPAAERGQPTDVNAEQKVEQLAGRSLQDNEVVTEAMAEVWEKQGNTEKAIDIYNKLSLLDTSKRAYFATKIEELKKTI
jgi:hypothetical protein